MDNASQLLKRWFALVLCGFSTFSLYPSSDYMQFASNAEQLAQKGWERTGNELKGSIDKVRRNDEQAQAE